MNPDESYLTWGEVYVGDESGCVVGLPHDADRFDVALAAVRSEVGFDADLSPGENYEITKAWGRLFTQREQWQIHHDEQPPTLNPPDRWYAPEGVPCWAYSDKPAEGFEPIWTIEWKR